MFEVSDWMNLVEELWKLNRKYSPYFTWGAKSSGSLYSAVPQLRARRKESAKEVNQGLKADEWRKSDKSTQ